MKTGKDGAIVTKKNSDKPKTNILEKEWKPGRYARIRAAEAAELARKNPSPFLGEPDDLVYDPRAGMKVSRFGQDKGARQRDTLTDHAGMPDGVQLVTRVRNGLDRMRQNGSISEDAYIAAILFQNEFEKCGYAKYVTINLNRTGGGAVDDVISRAQNARDYVGHVMRLLGGGNNPMTTVAFWSLGLGYGFERIAATKGDSKHYWRGVFMAAIRIMEDDYRRMCRGKGRKP